MENAEGQLGINEIIQAGGNEGSLPNVRLSDGFWEVYSPLAEHIEGNLQKLGYSPDEIKAAKTFLYEAYANARSAYRQQLLELQGFSVPSVVSIRQTGNPQAVADIQKVETGVGNESENVSRIGIDWNIMEHDSYINIMNNSQMTPRQKKRVDTKIGAARKDFEEDTEGSRIPHGVFTGISSITGSGQGIYRMAFSLLRCGADLSYTSGVDQTKFTAHIKRVDR